MLDRLWRIRSKLVLEDFFYAGFATKDLAYLLSIVEEISRRGCERHRKRNVAWKVCYNDYPDNPEWWCAECLVKKKIGGFVMPHDFEAVRRDHKSKGFPIKSLTINTRVTNKWRFVDLETHDIWQYSEEQRGFVRADSNELHTMLHDDIKKEEQRKDEKCEPLVP